MIWKVIGAFVAVYGFSILLEVPKRYLAYAGGVGAVGWLVYLVCVDLKMEVVMANFIAALVTALISHAFARMFKAPVTIFLISGILPMVPGAGMYRIVYYILNGDSRMSSFYFVQTVEIAGVIALAIFIMDTVFKLLQKASGTGAK